MERGRARKKIARGGRLIFNTGIGNISRKGRAWQERGGEKIEVGLWPSKKVCSFIFLLCFHNGIPILSYKQKNYVLKQSCTMFDNLKSHIRSYEIQMSVWRPSFHVTSSLDHKKLQIVPVHTNDREYTYVI